MNSAQNSSDIAARFHAAAIAMTQPFLAWYRRLDPNLRAALRGLDRRQRRRAARRHRMG